MEKLNIQGLAQCLARSMCAFILAVHTVEIKGPAHKAICKGCSHYNNVATLFKLAKS